MTNPQSPNNVQSLSFIIKRLYVMDHMPNTGHLVSDNQIEQFYYELKAQEDRQLSMLALRRHFEP